MGDRLNCRKLGLNQLEIKRMNNTYMQISKIRNIVNVSGDFNYRTKMPQGRYLIKTMDGVEADVQAIEVQVNSVKNFRKVEVVCEHQNLNLHDRINEHVAEKQHPVLIIDPESKEEFEFFPVSCFSIVSTTGKFLLEAGISTFDAHVVIDGDLYFVVKAYESALEGERDLKLTLKSEETLIIEKALSENKKCEIWRTSDD